MMLTYTFVFKKGGETRRRAVRVSDKDALYEYIRKAAKWAVNGRQAHVYGPGIRTVRCCEGTILQVQHGRLRVPLQ